MKTPVLSITALAVLMGCTAVPEARVDHRADAVRQIRAAEEAAIRAFGKRDAALSASMYAPDATLMLTNMPALKGAEIKPALAQMMADPNFSMSFNTAKVEAPAPSAAPTDEPAPTVGEVKEVSADDHVQGSASAPVTVITYSDFQCPFCGRFHARTEGHLPCCDPCRDLHSAPSWNAVPRCLPLQLRSAALQRRSTARGPAAPRTCSMSRCSGAGTVEASAAICAASGRGSRRTKTFGATACWCRTLRAPDTMRCMRRAWMDGRAACARVGRACARRSASALASANCLPA